MGQQCAQVAGKASSVLTYIGGGMAVRTREVMGALYLALDHVLCTVFGFGPLIIEKILSFWNMFR